MLQQNWFYQSGMILIADNPEEELYFDKECGCFYLLYEEAVGNGDHKRLCIKQYEPSDIEYETLMRIRNDYDIEGQPGCHRQI